MGEDRYIWCRNCDAIHHVTAFDRLPVYLSSDGNAEENPADDWREFMAAHAGHRLEPLTATGSDYSPDGSAFDPMRVRYLEVTNGGETLLLRRSRSSIDEAVRFSVVDGRLVDNGTTLGIQEDAIRKEMKLHFSWAPAPPLGDAKINRFIGLFREAIRDVDPAQVRVVEYSDSGAVAYCPLDAAMAARLVAKCRDHFEPAEWESLRRFIDTHRESDDVMALVKRRVVTVEQPSKQSPSAFVPGRR